MTSPVRLTLVRHGLPTAFYGDHLDPGLGDEGRAQASAAADALAAQPPRPIVTSPLRRAQETAAVLAARWRVEPRIEPRVGELAPADPDVDRRSWLRAIFELGSWDRAPADAVAWRTGVVDALTSLTEDTVVFSHYVVVNAALSAARDEPRLITVAPDYCSRHVFEVADGRLRVVQLGALRDTVIG